MSLLRLNKNSEFIHTLIHIRKTIPSAIIAGGAIRDLYHDKPINDIDIYVSKVGDYQSDEFWKQQFGIKNDNIFVNDYIKHVGGDDDSYEDKDHIVKVWEIRSHNILYNVIVLDIDPTEYVIRYFDIGLCKAYCDGTKIRLTPDFMYDSQFKKLTIVSESMPQDEFDHMMNFHIKKLQNKYPSHTLVVPEEYEELYKEYKEHNKKQ